MIDERCLGSITVEAFSNGGLVMPGEPRGLVQSINRSVNQYNSILI